MSDILNIVAKNIKKFRRAASFSQEELADFAGLHRTYIGMIERAEKNITILSLEKVARALDMPVSAFLEKDEDK